MARHFGIKARGGAITERLTVRQRARAFVDRLVWRVRCLLGFRVR